MLRSTVYQNNSRYVRYFRAGYLITVLEMSNRSGLKQMCHCPRYWRTALLFVPFGIVTGEEAPSASVFQLRSLLPVVRITTFQRTSLGDVETTAGRVGKTLPPKVATNPLQFVKVGPCDLYRSAQEQLKKVEEIKKAKKVQKDDVEDWQSASSTDGETTGQDETIVQLDKSLDKSAKDSKKAMLNSPSPPSPNESQEYTYEWAIQNYVNFAENRVKSKSTTNILDDHKKSNGREYPPIATKPVSTAKADNYLKSIDKNRSSPEERKTPVAAVPKVDISGRRQLFEKMQSPAEVQKNQRSSPETQGSKTIKDRLSFLGEQKKPENGQKDKLNGFPSEPLVKNRLMSIETISSTNGTPNRKSVEAITSVSVKDRLISLSKPDLSNATVVNSAKTIVEPSVSIKDRLTSLQSSIVKEAPKASIEILTGDGKRRNFKTDCKFDKEDKDYERSLSPDDGKRQDRHFRHRSLDSLDIDTENVASSSGSFERVQSLEDLDYRNYPPSTFSGDTDREDSGIHTADVSSSVSQADDYDLHLDGTIVDPHQPSIAEEVRSSASPFQPFQESPTPSASVFLYSISLGFFRNSAGNLLKKKENATPVSWNLPISLTFQMGSIQCRSKSKPIT
ncbi:unnamed protein product [Nesidiocoris tenuis]|uniref:Uncharacterized protein n=1 Tax=Nesidiocoris tenuis TaxID=355587 RepID=A0A6H5G099_9HEMI|nr:unnamed protein product [Nesidiocoris tenuis]